MTDKILVSRKEIKTLFRRAVRGSIFQSELTDLLDKAAISKPKPVGFLSKFKAQDDYMWSFTSDMGCMHPDILTNMEYKVVYDSPVLPIMDVESVQVIWHKNGVNRGEPIWAFDYKGHRGDVAFGGDTGWYAKLDNSGNFGYETAEEAKAAVEIWIKASISHNIDRSIKYLKRYGIYTP